jgi:hypothetical protein
MMTLFPVLQTEVVNVRLPRFRVEETTDLLEPVRSLGVQQVPRKHSITDTSTWNFFIEVCSICLRSKPMRRNMSPNQILFTLNLAVFPVGKGRIDSTLFLIHREKKTKYATLMTKQQENLKVPKREIFDGVFFCINQA